MEVAVLPLDFVIVEDSDSVTGPSAECGCCTAYCGPKMAMDAIDAIDGNGCRGWHRMPQMANGSNECRSRQCMQAMAMDAIGAIDAIDGNGCHSWHWMP